MMNAFASKPTVYAVAPFPRLRVEVPLFDARVAAGFPSPAEGYIQKPIDLNEFLIRNQPSTFIVRAVGDSMVNAPIVSGDFLVVDRSLRAQNGDVVLAVVDGEFTVKTYRVAGGRIWLQAENPAFPDLQISEEREGSVWGVVTGSFRRFPPARSHGQVG